MNIFWFLITLLTLIPWINAFDICEKGENCVNVGKCVADVRYRICKCLPGTEGVFCSEVTVCNENASFCGTRNETFCEFDSIQRLPICKCSNSSKIYDEREKICKKPCQKGECENGGKCIVGGIRKFCMCLPGTSGKLCSEVTQCNDPFYCGSSSNATCKYDIERETAVCKCLNPMEKFNYIEKICKEPCKYGDCENGGRCRGTCWCLAGTRGNRCSELVQCNEANLCGTSMNVICKFHTEWQEPACECLNPREEFVPSEKICKEPCQEGDCKNGGKCTRERNSKYCTCMPGFKGSRCSEVAECTEADFCGKSNNTICKYDTVLKRNLCECLNPWEEYDSSRKICKEPCQEGECENGGKCTAGGIRKYCMCLPGTSGKLCSEVKKCNDPHYCGSSSNATCKYDIEREIAVCECLNPMETFDYIEKICKEPCKYGDCENGGVCRGTCLCLAGTRGNRCSDVIQCNEANLCGTSMNVICKFYTEWQETECECLNPREKFVPSEKICKEPCQNDDNCENGGKCTGHGYFRFCECLPGTEGTFCSEITECKKNDFCGTSNETTCTYDNIQTQAICNCSDTSKKFDYKQKICKDPCEDDSNCERGHKCIGDEDSKFCECIPGKKVNFCSHVTDCNEPDSCGIGNNVTCEYDAVQLKATCRCSNSSTQFDYREQICKEPCREGDCENGGECTGHGVSKFCECLPGTTGDRCSEVIDCKKADFCGTGNDTTCVYNSTRIEAMCQCLNSSKQFDYKEKLCRETCQAGDCQNGANCTLFEDFKFCECLPGTADDFCSEVTECQEDNVCSTHNDSTCTYDSLRMEAICQCSNPNKQFDYKENVCKTPCGEQKCENGGICNGTRDLKFCECLVGTSGDFCTEISLCRDGVLCGNGSDVRCVFDKINQTAVCKCLNSNADFNYLTNTCQCDCGFNGTCALDIFGEKDCSCNEGFAEFSGRCKECSCGSDENCSFDSHGRKICTCNIGFRDLNGNCKRILLGESKESTCPALIASLFAFVIITFSGLFYLRFRKQKPDTTFHFKKLMESIDKESKEVCIENESST